MLTLEVPVSNHVVKRIKVKLFTKEMEILARDKFAKYVNEGVVIKGTFDDNEWILDDEKGKYRFQFAKYEFELRKILSNYRGFLLYLKIYIALRLGKAGLGEIRELTYAILRETKNSNGYQEKSSTAEKLNCQKLRYLIEFIKLYNKGDGIFTQQLARLLVNEADKEKEKRKENQNRPMEMCEFESYFKFDWILDNFWNTATEQEKNIFFPLYIYWKVTTIIPQRPTEFSIINYDCLNSTDGKYYIHVKRSLLKKGEHIHTYKKNMDYYTQRLEINQYLYNLIDEYVKKTRSYNHPYNELFSLEFYRESSGFSTGKDSKESSFGLKTMQKLLHRFYSEIICSRYDYSIVERGNRVIDDGYEKDCYLFSDEIMLVRLKDTRHLAMTNLILRGCSPMTIIEFADHEKVEMSINYYKAVSKAVVCRTMYFHDLSKKRINDSQSMGWLRPSYALSINPEKYVDVDAGRCYSEAFYNGGCDDCIQTNGNCIYCRHCEPKSKFDDSIRSLRESVDNEMDFLIKMLKDPRTEQKLIGLQNEIRELETQMSNLAALCWKKLVREDNGDETEIYDERIDGVYKEVFG